MEPLLRSVFRGVPAPWPGGLQAAAFLEYTQQQGVQPLVCRMLGRSAASEPWPAAVQEALQREAVREVARDIVVERELPRVLEALAAAGVQALLLKGTPLSFSLYPVPGLRPRADTDLLLQRADYAAADRALSALGYLRGNAVEGDFVTHQRAYGGPIGLDVHWKVLNPAMLAEVLSWQELAAKAVAVPALGPHARTPGAVHALLLACVHRAAHHGHDGSDRLIWLYDIHLLLESMDAAAFEEFAALAALRRVRTLCLAGIDAAHEWFSTKLFADISRRLLQVPDAAAEPSARYLERGLRRLDLWKLDFRHLHGRERIRLLREILFPPSEYILQKYKTTFRALAPALYVRRILSGAWKVLRRP